MQYRSVGVDSMMMVGVVRAGQSFKTMWSNKPRSSTDWFIREQTNPHRQMRGDYGKIKHGEPPRAHMNVEPKRGGGKLYAVGDHSVSKANSALHGYNKLMRAAGRPMLVVALVADVLSLLTADNKARRACEIVGAWGGALIGAVAGGIGGGIIGSAAPGAGTAVGVVVGGNAGSIAGSLAGESVGGRIYDWAAARWGS